MVVTKIQRMCFHDGPGIRTTVFLKGCSIHCPWCANPENLSFEIEDYSLESKDGEYGIVYKPEDLVEELYKDRAFWDDDGGVTFSGGEALMQADELYDVLKILKRDKIHTAIETALFVPEYKLIKVVNSIDYFIVDFKLLNDEICKNVLGGDIQLFKKNLDLVYKSGRLKLIRIPCCNEYTLQENNRKLLLEVLENYRDVPVQIFKIHSLGEKKYESLKREMWKAETVDNVIMESFLQDIRSRGITAEEISI